MTSSPSSLHSKNTKVNPKKHRADKKLFHSSEFRADGLAAASPADSIWDKHGSTAQDVISLFSDGDEWQMKKSENMESCGEYLIFAITGENVHKLRKARFCRIRLCPRCQWRKSLAWKARWYMAWPEIQ